MLLKLVSLELCRFWTGQKNLTIASHSTVKGIDKLDQKVY